MSKLMIRVLAAAGALILIGAGGAPLRELTSQEAKVQLVEGAGREKALQCVACHSLDYIHMNSPFLDKAGWTASINKMINAYGAPIAPDDVEVIAEYLARNYGKGK
jgi:mono/diheme cytochrome c family protein